MILNFKNKKETALSWPEVWQFASYRFLLVTGVIVLSALMVSMPSFFRKIELRDGYSLSDPLLHILPAINLSILIFLVIWYSICNTVIRSLKTPQKVLEILFSMILIILFRTITLSVVPLNPPARLIPIVDPISSLFYGGHSNFLTKDLFFSGHTSTVFLTYLISEGKREKRIQLVLTFVIAISVLIQHVHYTIDVIAAPFFCFAANYLAQKISKFPFL